MLQKENDMERDEDGKTMTEENKRSYPCDEVPKKRIYPCDETAGDREHSGEAERRPAGKGRRGGNSAMSFVIRAEKKEADGAEESGSRSGQRRGFGRRDSARGASFAGKYSEKWNEGGQHCRGEHGGFGGRRSAGAGTGADAGEKRRSFGHGAERRSFEGGAGNRRAFDGQRSFGAGAGTGEHRRFGARSFDGAAEPEGIEDFSSPKELRVLQNTSIGSFLALENGEKVLLPFAEQVGRPQEGETVSAYLYKDKGGRLTATMRTPILKTGEVGRLRVAEITRIGIFLDNGVPKQLLVPFKEQICTPKPGGNALVYLYKDKSGRQAATMRVYKHLSSETPYQANDRVEGFVYEINPELGVFLAVDDKYFGLIPKVEVYETYHYGQIVSCRVLRVREDGKLDLSAREKSYEAIERDAELVLAEIERQGGRLDYADKADAKLIEETYHMSKNQFKRAVGSLYRERKIAIDREKDTITLL